MIVKAIEKKNEDRAWQMWLVQYQHMTKENYISFEDFYSPTKQVESDQSVDEILNEVRNIISMKKGVSE